MRPLRQALEKSCAASANTQPVVEKCMSISASILPNTSAHVDTGVPITALSTATREMGLVPFQHEVDKNSYPCFLHYIGLRTVPAFRECVPTSEREGKTTMTYQCLIETVPRRHLNKRLGKPTNVSRVRAEELLPEVYRLRTQAR